MHRCRPVFGLLLLLLPAACGPGGRTPASQGASDPAWTAAESLPSPLPIGVTGRDARWRYRFPGPDGRLGGPDDRMAEGDLHLPAGTRVSARLKSQDALYVFNVPELGLRQIAVPDLEFALAFETGRPGRFALRGDPMCGAAHPALAADLVVEPPPEFSAWLAQLPAAPDLARSRAAARGD